MAQNRRPQAKPSADRKKAAPKNKWAIPVAAASAAVAILIAAVALATRGFGGNTASGSDVQASALKDQDLVIKTGEISETAAFYPVEIGGTRMEVVAVKAPDGTIRTAFNTCQVCYDSGRGYYKQDGGALVCQNCGNRFSMDRVEVEAGGCNPWPIFDKNKTVTDESITISYDFLKESKDIFANWKSS